MKHLLTILLAALLAGCCTAPTFTDKTTDTINRNAGAWDRIHTMAALALPADAEVGGKTRKQWLGYIIAAEANAIVLQHKAAGTKITYADAKAKAEELTLP